MKFTVLYFSSLFLLDWSENQGSTKNNNIILNLLLNTDNQKKLLWTVFLISTQKKYKANGAGGYIVVYVDHAENVFLIPLVLVALYYCCWTLYLKTKRWSKAPPPLCIKQNSDARIQQDNQQLQNACKHITGQELTIHLAVSEQSEWVSVSEGLQFISDSLELQIAVIIRRKENKSKLQSKVWASSMKSGRSGSERKQMTKQAEKQGIRCHLLLPWHLFIAGIF